MKKTITWVLLAAMLLSTVAMAIPANAWGDRVFTDDVIALLFTSPPTIDGYISEAEWGDVTVNVAKCDAATVESTSVVNNRFFYAKPGYDDTNLRYDLWLRWDAKYFYIGVKVRDPDGHSLRASRANTWNGDALEFRVDYLGPNSASMGFEFYFSDTEDGKPWECGAVLPDIMVGYAQILDGFTEVYDATNQTGLTAYDAPAKGAVKAVAAPAGETYSPDTQRGFTTYEIALPWNYVYYNEDGAVILDTTRSADEAAWGGIDRELGMSLAVYNAEAGQNGYNSVLSWGSGIVEAQQKQAPKTCGGSNGVLLSAETVTPEDYVTYDPTVLDGGYRFGPPRVDSAYYDYLGGDTAKTEPLYHKNLLTTLTYDDAQHDLDHWGSGEDGRFHPLITDISKTGLPGAAEHGNVLDYSDPNAPHITYLATESCRPGEVYKYPLSYTFEFDLLYTGNKRNEDVSYEPAVYNWFGGASGWDYICGYFFDDQQFQIRETDTGKILYARDGKLEPYTWYNWRFVYDNRSCNVRLYIDDTLVVNTWNRYFYYTDANTQQNGTMLLWRQLNTQLMMDNVRVYNIVGAVAPDEHIRGTFNGMEACVDENGNLRICEHNFPDALFREYLITQRPWVHEYFEPCAALGDAAASVAEDADRTYITKEECDNINLVSLYHSDVCSLEGIKYFTKLTSLILSNTMVRELDLSQNPGLCFLSCGDNGLTELDLSGNPRISYLYCANNQLTELDLSANPKLSEVNCEHNRITKLELPDSDLLWRLRCSSNRLTSLDVSGYPALKELYCFSNQLTALDVSHNPKLDELYCSSNRIAALDVSACPALEILYCSGNRLTALDVSHNPKLEALSCTNNRLTTLDLRKNPKLSDVFTYLSPQNNGSVCAPCKDGKWTVDLGAVVGKSNVKNITGVSAGKWDPTAGTVTFTEKPTTLTYEYDTGFGAMEVTLTVDDLSSGKVSGVSASNLSGGVKVTWNKLNGAGGYYIYRSKNGGSFTKVGTVSGADTVTWTDTNAKTNGAKYQYKVRAYIKSDGTTYKSASSAAKTIYRLSRPTVESVKNTSGGVKVTWNKNSKADGYYIYRSKNGGDYTKVKTISGAGKVSWTDTSAKTNGAKYQYKIKAYKKVDGVTYKSAYSAAKTVYRLSRPTIESAKNTSGKKITVTWNKNAKATGYQIKYVKGSTVKYITVSGNANVKKVISGLTKDKTYKVYVRSYKTVSGTKYYSAWSDVKSVKVTK